MSAKLSVLVCVRTQTGHLRLPDVTLHDNQTATLTPGDLSVSLIKDANMWLLCSSWTWGNNIHFHFSNEVCVLNGALFSKYSTTIDQGP